MTDTDENANVRQRLAENIRQRREQLGFTQQQLAALASLGTAQAVSAIELGKRDIKAVELAALAKALYCNWMDLFEAEQTHPTVAWRKRPEGGAEIEEARFRQLCGNYQLAEIWSNQSSGYILPSIRSPRGLPNLEWARAEAERMRESLGLGSLPAASLQRTLEEQCKVKIFFLPDLRGSAASTLGEFGAAIILNASEVPWRRNFSLAHELFHLVTWDVLPPAADGGVSTWPDRTEMLAEAFASALLLPADAVSERIKHLEQTAKGQKGRQIAVRGLVEVAREFDVSTAALLWRLVSLNRLKDVRARELLADPTFISADRATFHPTSPPDILPPRFLRLLEQAYLNGDVSVGRVAEMTGYSLIEARQRLMHLEEDEAGAGQLVRLA